MKTPNSTKVAAREKRGTTEIITPKSDSQHSDAGVSGIMTRSRLKRLSERDNKEACGTSESSADLRRALLRYFEDSPGTASLASTCASNKKSQKNALLEAKSVTLFDSDSVIHESKRLRNDESLKSDNNDKQNCANACRSVSVALYNAAEKENPCVTVTVSGLSNNLKADITIHNITKGRNEVNDTDSKVSTLLSLSNDDEQSPSHSRKEKKAVKLRKKRPSSLKENEWTVTAVSEHITECGSETDTVKFSQDTDEDPLRTEILDSPSVSSINDELSPNNSQRATKIKKSRQSKSLSPNKNGFTLSPAPEHSTELENEMCNVKSPQVFNRCKDVGNTIVRISPSTAEFEKHLKSDSIRYRETPQKSSTDLESDSKSEMNSEPAPNYPAKKRKAQKSRKHNSLLLHRNEWTVTTVSEHIASSENETGVVKSCQEFDRYLLKNTEPLDVPSDASNCSESSPHNSQKERKLKNSRRSKLSPPNENEGIIPSVPECTTESGNEICEVKSSQKFKQCKNTGNPFVAISRLPAEIEECLKSGVCISKRKIQLKNHTESALTDKAYEANKTSNENMQENVMEISIEKTCRTEKKLTVCEEQKGNKILEDVAIEMLASDEEVGELKSTGTNSASVVGPGKEQETSGTESPVQQYMYSENKLCNIPVHVSPDSEMRHVGSNHKGKNLPLSGSKMTKELGSKSSESDSDTESRKAIMESAQRRIIRNISTSESESKKFMRPRTESTGSDTSESVPEAMSFSAGRQMAMESLKNVAESIQKEKHRRKEKRKQRLEKYKQQKEEKLIRLKEKRASREDASCSSSEESGYEEVDVPSAFGKSNRREGVKWEEENLDVLPQSKGKRFHSDNEGEGKGMKDKKRKHEQKDTSQHFGNLRKLPDDVLENLPDQVSLKLQKTDSETVSKGKKSREKHDKQGHIKDKRSAAEFRNQSDTDYIPVSSCGVTAFGVMPLDKFMRAPKSMAERAAKFRQDMLFGSRIRRGPANAQAVYQHKLKASGRDRFFR